MSALLLCVALAAVSPAIGGEILDLATLQSRTLPENEGRVQVLDGGHAVRLTEIATTLASLELTYVHGFMTREECRELVRICEARDGFERSPVVSGAADAKETFEGETRTSTSCMMLPGPVYEAQRDRIQQVAPHLIQEVDMTAELSKRAADLLQVPLTHVEPLQVVHYSPGEQFSAHYDAHTGDRETAAKAQRRHTLLVFASDVDGICQADEGAAENCSRQHTVLDEQRRRQEEELYGAGGHLRFPALGLSVKPAMGDAVLWLNTVSEDSAGPIPESLHEGMAPVAGEKFAINIWTTWTNALQL